MKNLKRLLVMCMVIVLCISCFPAVTQAGYKLGDAYYTDVVTYINHYPIPCYNFQNNTLISVEHLDNYGLDVTYNEYYNMYVVKRSQDNSVTPVITFRKAVSDLWRKETAIYTTATSVFTGNYKYSSYEDEDGVVLIKLSDLKCISGVSVNWVPEVKAMKVWVSGAEMLSAPMEIKRIGMDEKYYTDCDYVVTYADFNAVCTGSSVVLTASERDAYGTCTRCISWFEITDVIDANGVSILKNKFIYDSEEATLAPYFYGFSKYPLSKVVILEADDLYTSYASSRGGLIKVKYHCYNCSRDIYETIKVDLLPR